MSLGFSPQRSAFMWTHPGRAVCGRPSRVESVTSIWTCVNVGHSQSCRLFTLESDEGLTCKTMTWTRTKKKQLSNKTCSVNVASVFLCNKMLFYRPDRVWKKGRVDDHDVTNSELLHEPKHLLSTHGLKSSSSDPGLKVMKQKCDIALISRLLKDPESQLRSSKTWVGGRQEQRETEEKEKKEDRTEDPTTFSSCWSKARTHWSVVYGGWRWRPRLQLAKAATPKFGSVWFPVPYRVFLHPFCLSFTFRGSECGDIRWRRGCGTVYWNKNKNDEQVKIQTHWVWYLCQKSVPVLTRHFNQASESGTDP